MKNLLKVMVEGTILVLSFGVGASLARAAEKSDGGGAKTSPVETLEVKKQGVAANIERYEERVAKKLAEVDAMTQSIDFKQFSTQRMAAEKLREILADLDLEASGILKAYESLGPDLKLLRQAVEQAPPVFLQMADDLERKSTEKLSPVIKDSYADFASEARNLASSYRLRVKEIDGIEVELAQKLEYVRESRDFLADATELLSLIPAQGGAATEKLLLRINTYVKTFEASLQGMRGAVGKISDPQRSSLPSATEPAPPVTSTSRVGEYRERVARLNSKK